MRAVLLPGDRQVLIIDRPKPEPGPGEVLLEMRAAGLCGSDLHMHYRIPAAQRRGEVFGLRTNPDIVPSHEPAGVVAAVGAGIDHPAVGDRVVVHHMAGCGYCQECRRGWDINCQQRWGVYGLDRPGALQDFMTVRARDCVIVPDNVTLAEAAYYSCGAGTGYLALRRAGFGLGDTVVVVGLGPVGLAASYFAQLAGATVIGIDTIAGRCAFARERGVQVTANPRIEDVGEVIAAATDGHGADVVVESSGSSPGRVLGLDAAAIRGRMVLVGFADDDTTIDVQRYIIQKQLDVRGAWMFPLPDLDLLLQDVSRRGISITPLIPARFPITQAEQAWRTFDAGSLGKTIISWEDGSEES